MIKLENYEVIGWEHAIRGMRNPMNSWEKSDSGRNIYKIGGFEIGPNDHSLMMQLRNAGTDHRKFMRMIAVYVDITAPLYWWKEFDTYKVGPVANSCSTMHKIHEKEFTLEDFSCEHLSDFVPEEPVDCEVSKGVTICSSNTGCLSVVCSGNFYEGCAYKDALYLSQKDIMDMIIVPALNANREAYLKTKDKIYWWQMIQLLPSSYNQKRTVMLNYEVLANIYKSRKNHKLDEWVEFCKWIETMPYSELIIGTKEDEPKLFYAGKRHKIVCASDCHHVKNIKPENLLTYNSLDEALADGCRPCKHCHATHKVEQLKLKGI